MTTQDASSALTLAAPELGAAMSAFMAASLRDAKVDIVTRELVRIYSGQASNCRFCRNLRIRGALDRGLDEEMVAKVSHFETSDLTERHKAALRLAQAFLVDPASFDAAAQADLLVHFRSDQIAELILDLIRLRPGSKLSIACGTDAEQDELVVI
jgi:alkylhydroperoxidase family enzyme